MTQLHFLTIWGTWAAGCAFWASLFFVPVVSLFWAWWRDPWGWNIVTLESVIALALLRATIILEFGVARNDYTLIWVGDIAVTLIPIIIIWRALLIWYSQYKGVAVVQKDGQDPSTEKVL